MKHKHSIKEMEKLIRQSNDIPGYGEIILIANDVEVENHKKALHQVASFVLDCKIFVRDNL